MHPRHSQCLMIAGLFSRLHSVNHCGINSNTCYWIPTHGINNPLWLSEQLPFLQSYCHLKIYFTMLLMRGAVFLLVSSLFLFVGSVKGMDGLLNLILSLFSLINQNIYSWRNLFIKYVICAMLHRRSLSPSLIL